MPTTKPSAPPVSLLTTPANLKKEPSKLGPIARLWSLSKFPPNPPAPYKLNTRSPLELACEPSSREIQVRYVSASFTMINPYICVSVLLEWRADEADTSSVGSGGHGVGSRRRGVKKDNQEWNACLEFIASYA